MQKHYTQRTPTQLFGFHISPRSPACSTEPVGNWLFNDFAFPHISRLADLPSQASFEKSHAEGGSGWRAWSRGWTGEEVDEADTQQGRGKHGKQFICPHILLQITHSHSLGSWGGQRGDEGANSNVNTWVEEDE